MAGGRGSLGDEQKGMRRLWRRRQLAALQRCRKLGCPLGEAARKCQDGSFCPPDAAQLVVTSRSCGIKGRRPAAAGHPRGKRVARIMWDEAPLLWQIPVLWTPLRFQVGPEVNVFKRAVNT